MTKKEQTTELEPIYLRLHLKMLLYLGIDIIPVEDPKRRFLYYIYAVLLLGFFLFVTILELLECLLNSPNLYKMTFGLSYFVTHFLGTVKMLIIIYQRRNLWKLCEKMEQGLFLPNVERGGVQEFKLIKTAIKNYNRQGLFFYTFVVIIISSLTISCEEHYVYDDNSTIISYTKDLPFNTLTPFEYSYTPMYQFIAGLQLFWAWAYGMYIGAADALICGFMMLLKAQFLILKCALDSLIDRAEQRAIEEYGKLDCLDEETRLPVGVEKVPLLSELVQKYVQQLTIECVSHHQQLIAFCDETEEMFSYLMLLQFLSSLYVICFSLFQLSMMSPSSFGFFSMACYMMLMTFQVLCYCWHGNEVQIESNNISDYVYHINWIITNKPVKNSLILMMMRSQRPFRFTAGKFAFLSLQTFMSIVRGSGSYFMVLRQMNNT